MKIESFAVEDWMDAHETTAKYNIAETCCASISVKELLELSSMPVEPLTLLDVEDKQTYGEIRGTSALRGTLAGLYSARATSRLLPDNILVTPGAISASLLIFYALLQPGDHVICHYPTYQSLYSVPQSLGADVSFWEAKPERNWELDIDDLKSLVKPNTKMIVLNNPHNPTGQILKKSILTQIIDVAQDNEITVFSDEVYRPIFHGIGPMDAEFPPSILSLSYDNTIATGSMSKAYSLAGLRIGWIASRSRDIVEKCASVRHYTTISVSKLDQQVASFALSSMTIHGLLGRNIALAKENLAILEKFISDHSSTCEWTKPVAGTTAFVKFRRDGKPVDSAEFCKTLQEKTGVMFLPGSCFGEKYKSYVRIGYVAEAKVVKEGFEELAKFMKGDYINVPTL